MPKFGVKKLSTVQRQNQHTAVTAELVRSVPLVYFADTEPKLKLAGISLVLSDTTAYDSVRVQFSPGRDSKHPLGF